MVSSNAYIWFGTPGSSMQWVPAPQAGFQRNWTGNPQTLLLDDGRQSIVAGNQKYSEFVGTYISRYDDPNNVNLDIFATYASGFYGTGPICFANPYAFTQNLFAPVWATPGLGRYGWASHIGSGSTYGIQTVSAGRQAYSASSSIFANPYFPIATSNRWNQYIAIPPGYTLYVGWSGSATGTAGILVQPYNASDNSLAASSMLTPLSITSPSQTNATFSGNTYNAVRIYATRTDTSASTITVNSMMARLYPSNQTPPSTYNHVPGQGNGGLKIVGSALAETYDYAGIKKTLQLTLEEVI